MVLKRLIGAAVLLALAAGCAKRVPPQRLPARAELGAALVLDPETRGAPAEAPEGLASRLAEALDSRNLQVARVGVAALGGQKLSQERVKALAAASPAPYRLLAETRAVFFSQLDGRYRWTVGVRLSATRASDGASAAEEFNLPAVLQYDHQRGPDAIEAVADEISRRAALLFDALIAAPASAGPAPAPAPSPTGASARPSSIYFVMVDRFADGDGAADPLVDKQDPQAFHGGDLSGLVSRLDWLQGLGVDTVWLSPVFSMRRAKYGPHGAFHGYWVEDLGALEPSFGGEAAFSKLAEALHARGMKLVLDVVLNHAAPDGRLVKTLPAWFHRAGGITDWNDARQLVERDVHGLPDLAEENPEVYAYLLAGASRWVGNGLADGLRLDAVKHMPARFWKSFGADLKRARGPAVWLLGEQLEGDPQKLDQAWRGGGFDAVFDFPLAFALVDVFCKDVAPERLASTLAWDRLYPDPSALVTLLDNHDLPRVASACGGDAQRLTAALTMLLTARGTPSLIWGTEVGLRGEKEPDNRADMRFEKGPLYATIARLLEARRRHPALSRGALAVHSAGERFVAFHRVAPDERALVAFNGSKAVREVALPGPGWADALDGSRPEGASGRVLPGQVRVWTARGDFAAEFARTDAQWRTGARKRRVNFELPAGARVAGSAPELGAWKPLAAVTSAELPVGSVFEFKLVRGARENPIWEQGDNRVLFVADGEGALDVKVGG